MLAWLLGEPAGQRIREILGQAQLVSASDLTLLECERVLVRAVALGEIGQAAAAQRRARLGVAASHWHLWRLSREIVVRASQPFPLEPIRTLDSLHLSAALAVRSAVPDVELLSLDDRLRRAGQQLGLGLQPEST